MATGKTLEMIRFSYFTSWRDQTRRETRPRDRSLNGKARIKARKKANRGE